MHEKDVVEEEAGGGEVATVMFDYEASSEFEITVSGGSRKRKGASFRIEQ